MPAPRVHTSIADGRLLAFAPTGPPREDGEPVEPTASFPTAGRPLRADTAPDLRGAVYTTPDELVRVRRDGDVLWRLALGSSDDPVGPSRCATCAFSRDGSVVWLHRPGPYFGSGATDRLHALDAATGAVLARTDLGRAGYWAGSLFPHPDGEHLLLSLSPMDTVDEHTFRARFRVDGTLTVVRYGFEGFLHDLSPDGRFLATAENDDSVTFRAFPHGTVTSRVTIGDFGYDDAFVREHDLEIGCHTAGFLDADTAVVDVHDDYGEGFHENHVVEAATGRVVGPLPGACRHRNVQVLGDGTWLFQGRRHSYWPRVPPTPRSTQCAS
ncbi:hypothetical protein [Nocardiopsis aegyptia]|uniref:Outer membrane protein assembly factor BamB n=1 Tax=Nocardiopsis aegyptia TaxID=220378 RepID=A0A7Z0ERH9_9ACTN|nr:hypothetical protein [Nocardiopsis aegyptia]NYJ36025.1 outer membrane protein assembly factor BamB [Nocardiopsis aegyptia]